VPGATPLSYGFPGYGAGSSGAAAGSYLPSPGLVYQHPQPTSSSYSPRSPAETAAHGLGVKVERSPDSQGASSAGSSSSGRPPTAGESPGPDFHRRLVIPPPPSGYYYPEEVQEMLGMYLPPGHVNTAAGVATQPHVSQQWMNSGRFAHQYMTSSGHVGSDVTDDVARISGGFTRLTWRSLAGGKLQHKIMQYWKQCSRQNRVWDDSRMHVWNAG